MKSKAIVLVNRPTGLPTAADFAMRETDIRDVSEGEVQVKNLLISVDPSQRARMHAAQALNETLWTESLGRVTQSLHPAFNAGDLVLNRAGMCEYFVSDGQFMTKVAPPEGLPLSLCMHVYGRTGFVAYGGLLHIAQMQQGETVFVSTAAGAVGSVAAQIAKIRKGFVIGSTGSERKVDWLRSVGLDRVINYKQQPILEALTAIEQTPDVYFDNVGGAHLDAALARMNTLGRVAACGMISSYNGIPQPVHNLPLIMMKRINLRGFYSADFEHLWLQFQNDMGRWLRDGRIQYEETFHDGIESCPAAMIGVMQGANLGKMLVRLPE